MRLDKFLAEMNIGTRSQVKKLVRQGLVTVNGAVEKDPDRKIDENADIVTYKGEILKYVQFVYYMLNKPQGVVSATVDNTAETVVALIKENTHDDLFPVGRLDKDTEGLLLLTNDGQLAHDLLSPRKHVDKTYFAEIEKPLSEEDLKALETGVDIGEDKLTLPAKVQVLSEKSVHLTICEGKFHQVKRMLQAVDNQVLFLKRVSFGPLKLDEGLIPGAYRELTSEEVSALYEHV